MDLPSLSWPDLVNKVTVLINVQLSTITSYRVTFSERLFRQAFWIQFQLQVFLSCAFLVQSEMKALASVDFEEPSQSQALGFKSNHQPSSWTLVSVGVASGIDIDWVRVLMSPFTPPLRKNLLDSCTAPRHHCCSSTGHKRQRQN